MTTFIGWTPPPGVEVVPPPVHPETRVRVIYSDAHVDEDEYLAHRLNWSAVGDGPSIVAYAVVEEYKPAPEPKPVAWKYRWKIAGEYVGWRYSDASNAHPSLDGFEEVPLYDAPIHVREVTPAAREVVAWAVFRGGQRMLLTGNEIAAEQYAGKHGGTVVKLTGVLP
jgi:hypothetical protein